MAALRVALAAAFIVAWAPASHADTIIWHVPGVLSTFSANTDIAGYLQNLGFAPGQFVNFHLTIDTTATDFCPSPDVGLYNAGRGLTVEWDGHTGASPGFYVQRSHHPYIGGCFPDPETPLLILGFPISEGRPFDFALLWQAGGDYLPTSPPATGSFWIGAGRSAGWYGSLGPTRVEHVPPTTVIPEPGTLLLLTTGLVAVAARRRRMR